MSKMKNELPIQRHAFSRVASRNSKLALSNPRRQFTQIMNQGCVDDDDDVIVVNKEAFEVATAHGKLVQSATTKTNLPVVVPQKLIFPRQESLLKKEPECKDIHALETKGSNAMAQLLQAAQPKLLVQKILTFSMAESGCDKGPALNSTDLDEMVDLPATRFVDDGYFQDVEQKMRYETLWDNTYTSKIAQLGLMESSNEETERITNEVDDQELEDEEQECISSEDEDEEDEDAKSGSKDDCARFNKEESSEFDEKELKLREVSRSLSSTISSGPGSLRSLAGSTSKGPKTLLKRRTESPSSNSRKRCRSTIGRGTDSSLLSAEQWVSIQFGRSEGVLIILDDGGVPYSIPEEFLCANSSSFKFLLEQDKPSSEQGELRKRISLRGVSLKNFSLAIKWMGCKAINMKEIEGVTPALTITNILEVVNLAERLALHGLVEYLARKTKHILELHRSALTHKHIETAFQLSGPHMQNIFVDACVMPLMQFLHDERHDGDREESSTEDDGEEQDPARQQFMGLHGLNINAQWTGFQNLSSSFCELCRRLCQKDSRKAVQERRDITFTSLILSQR